MAKVRTYAGYRTAGRRMPRGSPLSPVLGGEDRVRGVARPARVLQRPYAPARRPSPGLSPQYGGEEERPRVLQSPPMQAHRDLIVEPVGLDVESLPRPLVWRDLYGNDRPVEV